MVDVSGKETNLRSACASVCVQLNESAFEQAKANESAKGAILTVAKIAGISAAKKTSELIPLCHQIPLDSVEIQFTLDDSARTVTIESTVTCSGRTGVEMEALSACSVSALTVYDMLKAVQKDILISDLKLLRKTGGKSGDFLREE
jgi:cyclic pyranopterin phosphate synthase